MPDDTAVPAKPAPAATTFHSCPVDTVPPDAAVQAKFAVVAVIPETNGDVGTWQPCNDKPSNLI